uniref:Caspase recruitment domain family, member 19 n=1 Tax=Lates calcarifer TaxID=8187 RepID=A0A4W6EYQ8_LATCA
MLCVALGSQTRSTCIQVPVSVNTPAPLIFPLRDQKSLSVFFNRCCCSQFRNLDVPTSIRLGELLTNLQGKGEEACREFYRALHLHVEEVYYSLPTRLRLRDSLDPLAHPRVYQQRHVLNDRGPFFFLGCFSVAVGMALLYYYSEAKVSGGSRALGMAALGLKRKAQEVLIWYTEESFMN